MCLDLADLTCLAERIHGKNNEIKNGVLDKTKWSPFKITISPSQSQTSQVSITLW